MSGFGSHSSKMSAVFVDARPWEFGDSELREKGKRETM